jgi:hypothetical protein
MKVIGLVMMILGSMAVLNALLLPTERFEAFTWKATWVQNAFGRKGVRIYYLVLGLIFVWSGYHVIIGRM